MSMIEPVVDASTPTSTSGLLILLVNVGATLFMAGFIWTMQVVHYRLFNRVGTDAFADYETAHNRLFFLLAGPAVLLAAGSALMLHRIRPPHVPLWAAAVSVALVVVIAISTALFQAPQHAKLADGFDQNAYQFLLNTNWIRTAAWTAYALLDLWLVWRVARGA